MPIEETGETRVKSDCLNFGVSLCIQIKNQNSIRAVVSNLGVATPWGFFAFLLGVARASDKYIHNYF